MKMQRSNGFLVPVRYWLGYQTLRAAHMLVGDELVPIPKGSNLEGLGPADDQIGGGMMVRWKNGTVGFIGTKLLHPLTPEAREFLKVCA